MGNLAAIGYGSAQGRAELERLMRDERSIIVDIRLSPRSALPGYSGAALAARWPGRYVHVPALGNRRYRERLPANPANPEPPPIEIVDLAAGVAQVQALLRKHHVILLCGCTQAERCHRSVVLAACLLQSQLGSADPPGCPDDPGLTGEEEEGGTDMTASPPAQPHELQVLRVIATGIIRYQEQWSTGPGGRVFVDGSYPEPLQRGLDLLNVLRYRKGLPLIKSVVDLLAWCRRPLADWSLDLDLEAWGLTGQLIEGTEPSPLCRRLVEWQESSQRGGS